MIRVGFQEKNLPSSGQLELPLDVPGAFGEADAGAEHHQVRLQPKIPVGSAVREIDGQPAFLRDEAGEKHAGFMGLEVVEFHEAEGAQFPTDHLRPGGIYRTTVRLFEFLGQSFTVDA